MPSDAAVLSVEFKVNLLSPARKGTLQARAQVVRAGRTLSVCTADAHVPAGGGERHVATMLATMMAVGRRPPDVPMPDSPGRQDVRG
jgi:acyl-coenzyme A thioesterase PaaI-like protein